MGPSLAQGTAAFSINVLLCGPRDQGKAESREGGRDTQGQGRGQSFLCWEGRVGDAEGRLRGPLRKS